MCVPHCRADLRTNLHRMGYDVRARMYGRTYAWSACVREPNKSVKRPLDLLVAQWAGIRLVMWVCAGDAPARTLYEHAGYPRQ